MKLVSKFAGIGAALLMASTSASAIVNTWGYSVSSAFIYASYSDGNAGAIPGGTPILSWGGPATNAGQSSLAVGNSPALGSVDTYLGLTPPQAAPYLGISTSLTHTNNPIYEPSLTSAILGNSILLTPLDPAQAALAPFNFLFNIAFTETTNGGTCAVAGSPTPCNDIFVLTSGLLNSSFGYDDGSGLSTYYVNIFPTDGNVLSQLEDNACIAAGVGLGCIGFSTPEGQATTLPFGFTISSEPLQVPEPGALALFGTALMGLFAWRRRQQV